MKVANPYLYFAGNTEEAFGFYRSVFGGDFRGVLRYGDFPENPMGIPDEDLDKIAHIALPLGNESLLMGTDYLDSFPDTLTMGNNVVITLEPESGEEAERLFGALSEGGKVTHPLRTTEWAEKHGGCQDRFGVHWMVDYTGNVRFSEGA
jgi:PhnB protein